MAGFIPTPIWRTCKLTVLAAALALGLSVLASQGPVAIGQEPGFCHQNPELCTEWTGAACDRDCTPGNGFPCCTPGDITPP